MPQPISLTQFPEPGKHLLHYCGDIIDIRLRSETAIKGKAFLSTNIGHAARQRDEIIEQVEKCIPAGGQDWSNIPMVQEDPFTFSLRLALNEVGHFELKGCVILQDDPEPVWAQGNNVHINVISAAYCCSNSIYCAFVRQFGSNCAREKSVLPDGVTPEQLKAYDDLNYTMIPPSGTFRQLIAKLDHIIGDLKCRILHLLPVNPTPTVYGRMGRYGSPYAALDFTAIDPSLADFDRKATPLDQFLELVNAVHSRNAKVFIDIAINHTGWAAKLQETHPEWFVREQDGTLHSPGAWGVTWGDLVELDHKKLDLWKYLGDVFLTWCERGVDGFRCDAGYMIPEHAWAYIIARVRQEYPDTIFLLEGLGGAPEVTSRLLDVANMDWAYSELFQNYSRSQIEGYLSYAWRQSSGDGLMVHYAETHDNSRLAAVSLPYARMRTVLCALSSVSGAFGFANGVEWFAKEKIDVHEARALNWGAKDNQVSLIARLNSLMGVHPAFHDGAMLMVLDSGCPDAVVFQRCDSECQNTLIIAINLNTERAASVCWDSSYASLDQPELIDLLSGHRIGILRQHHERKITLPPAGYVCLSDSKDWLHAIEKEEFRDNPAPDRLTAQRAASWTESVLCTLKGTCVMGAQDDIPGLAAKLRKNPEDFLENLFPELGPVPYVSCEYPADFHRELPVPPGLCMIATAPCQFRMTLRDTTGKVRFRTDSMPDASGRNFILLPPSPVPETTEKWEAEICAFDADGKFYSGRAPILLLPEDVCTACVSYDRDSIYHKNRSFLQGNGRGAITFQKMELGRLDSRYDAILLANLSGEYPEDRHIIWRRIRVWLIYHARLQELKHENISRFYISEDGGGVWEYLVPVGSGLFVPLTIKMEVVEGRNAVLLTIRRGISHGHNQLSGNLQVSVIVSPDMEDRCFHNSTKASAGPERDWPGKMEVTAKGFRFHAAPDRTFVLQASKGNFCSAPQWHYMIHQENEANRGLDPDTDLYSPGYFRFFLNGDESVLLSGEVLTPDQPEHLLPVKRQENPFCRAANDIESTMLHALRQFVVKRGNLKTVIAGYPWFLDWGRDTLIAARGLIAAEEFRDDVRKILMQFASFAENGTIPNMISGDNADNRDTSDAPLWLFTAVSDLCRAERSKDFLQVTLKNGKTLLDTLVSLAEGLIHGTPNGIRVDPESALVFSPPHFTWMDTNYPAGTPREGYPVEIQALWFAALRFLAESLPDPVTSKRYADLAEQVRASILKFFVLPGQPYLSDCLHAKRGVPAAQAQADDLLRPNQLLALTLGAVTDPAFCREILKSCYKLLIPGAIRSLADQRYTYPTPVYGANGQLLNDPQEPYWGHYEGDEDTRRKPAYHNGTAWTWQFPLYAEACYMAYGKLGLSTAISLLSSMSLLMDGGCIGQVPEILDGDYPHTPRGCEAQAWGMSEYYRVWVLLHRRKQS